MPMYLTPPPRWAGPLGHEERGASPSPGPLALKSAASTALAAYSRLTRGCALHGHLSGVLMQACAVQLHCPQLRVLRQYCHLSTQRHSFASHRHVWDLPNSAHGTVGTPHGRLVCTVPLTSSARVASSTYNGRVCTGNRVRQKVETTIQQNDQDRTGNCILAIGPDRTRNPYSEGGYRACLYHGSHMATWP